MNHFTEIAKQSRPEIPNERVYFSALKAYGIQSKINLDYTIKKYLRRVFYFI